MAAIATFTFNPFEENTYVIYNETGNCIIVDPGCSNPEEEIGLTQFITEHKLKPKLLVNTHGHADHMLGNYFVHQRYGLFPWIHRADEFLLKGAPEQGKMFGISLKPSPSPSKYLEHGDILEAGEERFNIIHTPGHSPGGISIFSEKDKWIIVGDTLFMMSIGRTDLPGGDYNQLIEMIKTRIFSLEDDVTIYSGHGPSSTIGFEKENNPFLI